MKMSAGLRKSSKKTSIDHNNRKQEKYKNNEIDLSRSKYNNYLKQENLKELYNREFGEALKKYNDKQKRKDRKIKSYYEHIRSGKKTAVQQEMIIQVGSGFREQDYKFGDDNWEAANEILEEYFRLFEERNPNLKVYNAVIHNDETSPHLHINFVPVASGYQRGLEKQVAFDRAIKQQANEFDVDHPFEAWRENEVGVLEKLMNERGIERKLVGTNEYDDMPELKHATAELEKIEKQKNVALAEQKRVIENTQQEFDDMADFQMPQGYKEIQTEVIPKILGKPEVIETATENVVFTPQQVKSIEQTINTSKGLKTEYERLNAFLEVERADIAKERDVFEEVTKEVDKELNERAERLKDNRFKKIEKENVELKEELSAASKYVAEVIEDNERLKEENNHLKYENKTLREKINYYIGYAKDLWDSAKSYFSIKSQTDPFFDSKTEKEFDKHVRRGMELRGYEIKNAKQKKRKGKQDSFER